MILFISIIITQRKNSTQQSKNLRMYNIIMYVRILIITTKRLTRHATELYKPCGRKLGRSVTKKLDHNKSHKQPTPLPKPRQPPKRPPSKPDQQTSEALHPSHINTHPKPITQPSSTHIRSSSLKSHQRTSEALLSSHISTHPKLFSQVPQNSHQNSGYQSTSQSVNLNQSGQPSFSIIIIQNTPKINLNITQKHHTLSKTASIPNPLTTNRKKTHPTHIQRSADATPRW